MTDETVSADAGQTMPAPAPRTAFLGLEFDNLAFNHAVARIAVLSRGEAFSYIVTPNVDHIVQLHRCQDTARTQDPLWQAYRAAALRLCDSRVLARLARLSGLHLPVVAGSDLTAALLADGAISGWRIAVIGGSPAQLDWLKNRRPDCEWVQMMPPMGVRQNPDAQRAIVDFIASKQADLVLFAIGAPQSELVAHRALHVQGCRGVGLCIGASIEFITGEKRRAPPFWQKLGLEWAFRLLSEPRRLWRRYLVEGPAVFRIWWQWRTENREHSR